MADKKDIPSSGRISSRLPESLDSSTKGVISVFWDMENCPVPLESSVTDFVKQVRFSFYDGRTEADFWVVCDMQNLKSSLSDELKYSDVTTVQVNGRNENAAHAKIISLLQNFKDKYKQGNLAIVLIISGYSDFAPVLSNMNFDRLVLICRKNARHSVLMRASSHNLVFYEDFITGLPKRKDGVIIEYLIMVLNFPVELKDEVKTQIGYLLRGLHCRLEITEGNFIEIVFPHESTRSSALLLLENYQIRNFKLHFQCMHIETSGSTFQTKKNEKAADKSNLVANKLNASIVGKTEGVYGTDRSVLCMLVEENVGEILYWQKELEKMWNMADFTLKWEGGLEDGYILAIFNSLNQAKKARKVLLKAKDPNAPKYLKIIKESNFSSCLMMPTNACDKNKRKIEDQIRIIESKKTSSVAKHKKKIDNLKSVANPFLPGSLESIASKRKELEEQLNNFLNYTYNATKKMKLLNLSSNLDEILMEIMRDFYRESNCFTNALPIYAKKSKILKKIQKHQVVIIRADAGSGKSTQLAQYIWRDQSHNKGLIVCTQPRKLSAITLAKHVTSQLGYKLDDVVGYQVGKAVRKSANTSILYVTDLEMLKMIINNEMSNVSVMIVDEADERTLYTDLLLGIIKSLLPTHPNLKIIITLATIDTSVFSSYFGLRDDAILEISGRTFPIEDVWLDEDVHHGWDYITKSIHTVCTLMEGGPGDVLVFLATPLETEKAVRVLTKRLDEKTSAKVKILHLHELLEAEEQRRVFERTPSGVRKVVFATGCAETAVTVPGVKFVIDCGMVRELRYDSVLNTIVMSVNFVSQSSAEQRRGRAGRTQSGKCFRLYSKSNFNSMAKITEPEILTVNLGHALLTLKKTGVTDPLQFDFVQSPPRESLNHAMNQLILLKAVNPFDLSLTDLGDQLSHLPLEPRLSHLVLRGISLNIGYEAVAIATLVTDVSRSLYFRTTASKPEPDTKKMRFCQNGSDFMTFLEVYREWLNVPKHSKSEWCTLNGINAIHLKTAHELVNELVYVLQRELNLKVPSTFAEEPVQDRLHKLIFQSFFQNLCIFSGFERFGYKSPSVSGNLLISHSSSLPTLGLQWPQFLIYDTIMKTDDKTYLINVSPLPRNLVTECAANFGLNMNIQAFDDLQLREYPISPIGKVILSDLMDEAGEKRKFIQNELEKCLGTDYLAVDIDVDKGELKIMGPPSKYDEVFKVVSPIIEKDRETLLKEEREVVIYPGLCAIISAGCNCKDVILPGEFRDLKVLLHRGTEIESVVQKLETCGQVFCVKERENYYKATFSNPAQAKQALDNFKNDSSFALNKLTQFFEKNRSTQFNISVSFLRRSCTGVGYISIHNPDATGEVLKKLSSQPVCYEHSQLKFYALRETGNIKVTCLPPGTEKSNFRDFINSQIREHGKVNKCVITRKRLKKSWRNETEEVKERLLNMFGEFTSKEKLSIKVNSSNYVDAKWNVSVCFDDPHHGETALKALRDKRDLPWLNFKMRATLQTFLYCKLEVFYAIRYEILRALEYFRKNTEEGNTLDIIAVPKDNSNCEIKITSNNLADMHDARRCILNFLQGDSIECHGIKEKLLTGTGKEFIQNVTSNLSDCYVELNHQKKILTIFGGDFVCSTVKNKINGFLDQVGKESFEEISLKKPGVLRELLKKYGHSLEELKILCGLTNIDISLRQHMIKVVGSASSISKCREIINELKVQAGGNILSEDEGTCPVCLSSISENFHRLEYCGHAYCIDCISHLLDNSEGFPLICRKDNCGALIVMADIDWAMKEIKFSAVSLYKKSLIEFLKNREDVSFCPSPDCAMIFRVSSDENTFECPSCKNSICTKCKEIYHYGMSCSLYQDYKKDKVVSSKLRVLWNHLSD